MLCSWFSRLPAILPQPENGSQLYDVLLAAVTIATRFAVGNFEFLVGKQIGDRGERREMSMRKRN